jgi:hypothetical protein
MKLITDFHKGINTRIRVYPIGFDVDSQTLKWNPHLFKHWNYIHPRTTGGGKQEQSLRTWAKRRTFIGMQVVEHNSVALDISLKLHFAFPLAGYFVVHYCLDLKNMN